ncbi:glycosyltransferase family 4 protein [Luteolibacter yonseiensis]|uniref:Glycosyltransferase family 4 protein n=1 Tax=Luteolibacter yonseiensis TaxID=1144680 RepID=A0A934R664_9BACT|nr:glycosyltransferase family 1 protein [Luteolibacter yonseiensis]MBK1817946.1 glycosyltransferase family 4 protein [Luteolibacter yonseiensis]
MKVLLSAGMIQGGRSGVGRYVIALGEALVREQKSVDLYIAGLDADRALFPWLADDRWVSIPADMGGGVKNLIWHQLKLNPIVRELKIDLVHIPSYRRMLWNCAVPQVATIHDCAPFILREKYDFFRGFFGRVIVPRIARRVRRVIAVSETTGRDVIRYMKVPSSRVTVVPNGIDHGMFKPSGAEAVAAFKQRKKLDQPFFLYVARLEHPAKNHVRLIHAFEKLVASGRFGGQLILPGAPWHRAEVIEQAVADSPVRERIRLEGFVDNADLPLWYASAEALIFPSLMEGFGLPLLESQACGTRIACANSTSLPEVAGPVGILFDGLDENSIAAAMEKLSTMEDAERRACEAAGIEWAGGFTWSSHARAAAEIYRETLQTH